MKPRSANSYGSRSLFLLLVVFLFAVQARAASVLDSVHNLSVSGTGSVRAATATDVCVFCHTPHGGSAQTPLWNHSASTATYIPYKSSTMIATVGQPNGASVLCLSCHDGTVAVGMVNNCAKPITMQNGVTVMTSTSNNLGTDLSQDHPISFTYSAALSASEGQLAAPSALTGPVKLDSNSQMQCTSCHDPHNDQFGDFLVMDNSGSALCLTCHTAASWAGSAHNLSTLQLTGAAAKLAVQSGPKKHVKTVAANACSNCHSPHKAAGRQQLLRTPRQEQGCFTCHNGTVDRQNIEAEFNKLSVHPVLQSSRVQLSGNSMLASSRQVTCSDCHNSHAAKNTIVAAPGASGPILGVKGITISGAGTSSSKFEYELCLRCHGDSAVRTPSVVDRLVPQRNLRLAFSPANSSFHPVARAGTSSNVPSLLSPYTTGRMIKCTDCHNNDQGPGAGGNGPRGPHGSAFAPLLERQLITTDHMSESLANYALCYKCHNRESSLSDQSFRAVNSLGQDRGHRFHIVDQQTACTTCHDSHGVATSKHLINFNPDYVTASSNGRIQYVSTGVFRGTCTLTCHGFNHLQSAYPALMLNPVSASKSLLKPQPFLVRPPVVTVPVKKIF
jgi:predicted CXXCH cytochrome family protein